jgi:hypothetical protein
MTEGYSILRVPQDAVAGKSAWLVSARAAIARDATVRPFERCRAAPSGVSGPGVRPPTVCHRRGPYARRKGRSADRAALPVSASFQYPPGWQS